MLITFERWPQLFFMITFDLDASKRNFLNKKLGQLGHPFDSPIQQEVPQLQDLFPSKNLNIRSKAHWSAWCGVLLCHGIQCSAPSWIFLGGTY